MIYKNTAILLLSLVGLLITYPLGAWSQPLPEEESGQVGNIFSGNWDITVGVGVGASPIYPGAKSYDAHPFLVGSASYKNFSFLGATGLGLNIVNWNGFRAGPIFGYQGGRSQNSDPHLNGLGNIQASISAGIFADYDIGAFELAGTFRQAIIHSNNGFIGRVQVEYHQSILPDRLDFEIGPEFDFGDERYEKTWFGISADQSVHSGLPVFSSDSGITDAGAHLTINYHYSKKILFRAFGDIRQFVGDVSHSPIIESKTQGFVGIAVAYHWGDFGNSPD